MKPGQSLPRVVHLITLLELGGAQGNTLYTVEHLNKQQFEVELWCGKGAYWDQKVNLSTSIRVRFFSHLVRSIHPLKDLLALFELTKALKKAKLTVLHTHSSKAGILGRLAGWWAGVPYIIHTFHGFGFNNQQRRWMRGLFIVLEKLCARHSSTLVFVSESNKKEALERKIGNPDQYILIRSGVPLRKISETAQKTNKNQLRTSLNIPSSHKVICSIGPFKPQKNYSALLEVVALVIKEHPYVSILIVGDGFLRPRLEQQIKNLNLTQNVQLLGWREDIFEILSISDIYVMTSLWEGLPRSLVEALSLKIPAVCFDTDGIRDLLQLGGGCLIPQKETQKMAEEILKILQNNNTNIDFPPVLMEKIQREFDIDRMVRQQEELYNRLLGSQ